MKIHKLEHWEYWYDPHDRVWFAMPVDEIGNQLDESINAPDRESIKAGIRMCLRSEQKGESYNGRVWKGR